MHITDAKDYINVCLFLSVSRKNYGMDFDEFYNNLHISYNFTLNAKDISYCIFILAVRQIDRQQENVLFISDSSILLTLIGLLLLKIRHNNMDYT